MMKAYRIPEVKLIALDVTDIITTSTVEITKSNVIPNMDDVKDSVDFA